MVKNILNGIIGSDAIVTPSTHTINLFRSSSISLAFV